MHLHNKTEYPRALLLEALTFAFAGISTHGVSVRVEDAVFGANGGTRAALPHEPGSHIVRLAIAAPGGFPASNTPPGGDPYGGPDAPVIRCRNWREAVVAIGAHEARHVWQAEMGLEPSELDAEIHAACRLADWRTR